MLIIGEKINASRKEIASAIETKNKEFIQRVAIEQAEHGADMLDINCGLNIKDEPSNMEWLIRIVQDVVNLPLVIDSPNPETIEAGLKVHKGRAMINSITAEKERYEKILPLAKRYNSFVIALTIDEKGMPKTAEERLEVAKNILSITGGYNVPPEDVLIDPLVRPVSTEPEQIKEFLESIKLIKASLKAKTICGLSNVSFGLPNRSLLNCVFLAMALYSGLDAAILDPTDKMVVSTIFAFKALTGEDEYCLNYISAFRKGRLNK